MLTQKGTQRIEVIVRKEGGGAAETNSKEVDAENIGGGGDNYSFWLGTSNPSRKARVLKTNATHAVAVSKQITDLILGYKMAEYGLVHGDQALQETLNRQVEIVKDIGGLASSVSMGALYGSWGGPIGTVLGATFALASTGTSTAVKYLGRRRDFNYKTFKENNAIEYQRARASINLTTGRLR